MLKKHWTSSRVTLVPQIKTSTSFFDDFSIIYLHIKWRHSISIIHSHSKLHHCITIRPFTHTVTSHPVFFVLQSTLQGIPSPGRLQQRVNTDKGIACLDLLEPDSTLGLKPFHLNLPGKLKSCAPYCQSPPDVDDPDTLIAFTQHLDPALHTSY